MTRDRRKKGLLERSLKDYDKSLHSVFHNALLMLKEEAWMGCSLEQGFKHPPSFKPRSQFSL
jgi:hypothetical protein